MMADALFALALLLILPTVQYGPRALLQSLAAMAACAVCDILYGLVFRHAFGSGDPSALVTGLTVSLLLPVNTPYWLGALAGAFAILIAKAPFGSTGRNLFNPAAAGVAAKTPDPTDAGQVREDKARIVYDAEKRNALETDKSGKRQEKKEEKLPVYDPAKDKGPDEGIPIAETKFTFSEPLIVRPKTDTIVIHHVGVPAGDTTAAAIHKAHLANGWAGIGYHYVIRTDGTIERGRPLATVGAHAQGHNFDTVGINVTGNFDVEKPTAAQLKALENLLASLCSIYGIEPGAATICGHRDFNATDCPGKNLYALLPQIRQDVKVKLAEDELKDFDIRSFLQRHSKAK